MKNNIAAFGAMLILAACDHPTDIQHTMTAEQLQKKNTATVPVAASTSISYQTCNSRYGYCLDYPADVLFPEGESDSGDGQVFRSKDGANTLRVYRDLRDNMDPDTKFTIEAAYNEDIQLGSTNHLESITYKKLGKDFYVLSGYHETKIFYKKTILSDGQLLTCVLEYKTADKKLFDKISEHVSKSLK